MEMIINILSNIALLAITLTLCALAYRLMQRPSGVERWQRDSTKRMAHRVKRNG